MQVLLTGGAGFIGSHLAATLLEAGHEVRVLDALLAQVHGGRRPAVPDGVEFRHGDIRSTETVESALRGIDAVCHQAAMVGRGRQIAEAELYAECNDLGTARLLVAMTKLGIGYLVMAGSVVIYGEGRYACAVHGDVAPGPRIAADLDAGRFDPRCPHCDGSLAYGAVDESGRLDPRNIYGATKLAQEHLSAAWARETGGTALVLRYHQVYGPGMRRDSPYSGTTATFRSVLSKGGAAIEVFEDGQMMRDFVHVRDVARANLAALAATVTGYRAFNVASGDPRSVGALAQTMSRICGAPEPRISGRYRFDDVRHIVASPARLMRELGWRPEVGFEQGMKEFVTEPMRE